MYLRRLVKAGTNCNLTLCWCLYVVYDMYIHQLLHYNFISTCTITFSTLYTQCNIKSHVHYTSIYKMYVHMCLYGYYTLSVPSQTCDNWDCHQSQETRSVAYKSDIHAFSRLLQVVRQYLCCTFCPCRQCTFMSFSRNCPRKHVHAYLHCNFTEMYM